MENTGLFNKIAQKVFNKPQYTKVHLDAQGTFIWPLIDGKRTVSDIAALVKEEFGEAAEPLYPRIIKYFEIVASYHFIKFANKPSKLNMAWIVNESNLKNLYLNVTGDGASYEFSEYILKKGLVDIRQ